MIALDQPFLWNVHWAAPELILAGFALGAVVIGAWGKDKAAGFLSGLGAIAFATAGVLAFLWSPELPQYLFNGALVVDGFSGLAKAMLGLSAAATLLIGADYFAATRQARFEFPIMTGLAALGMFVMVSANDLITLYVGLELQSLAAYVMAAWRRDDVRSSEAGIKYFVLGAIASGLLLFGASYIYGFTGSVRFDAIAAAAPTSEVGLLFGLVLVICALAFKMSAAPFHMWTPDVYEGAPTPVTAFFAAAPKLAAIALLARVLYAPFDGLTEQWRQVIFALSALSMTIGSIAALMQTNLKRLMAYSSVANVGFALMALAAGGQQGAATAIVYMAIYLPTTIGIFALVLALRRGGLHVETIDDLAGLGARHPFAAALFTILLFSIAGIPPLAGFFGKLIVFRAAVDAGAVWLAVVGAICAVIAAAYYLRVLSAIWFKPPAEPVQQAGGAALATAAVASALIFPILVIGLGTLERWATLAASTSF
ncbi:MAG: NADH-quinone oxidoreductase subunit NuoN [Alphaproteobacteria bacterium]|nr:NADH-quinone oxidoreductase subunit NuoN [Alphaproteobacteria bacterium]